MAWRDKLRNPFVQQYLVEILFPLIGFFFFDWSIAIIALFYLMDHFGSETAFLRRLSRVAAENNAPVIRMLTWSAVAFLLVFVAEIYLLLATDFSGIMTNTESRNEVMVFIKEEAWFLFPLVIFMYHFKDQFTFYMPRRYLNYYPVKMQRYRFALNAAILVLLVGGISLLNSVELPGALILLVFLVLKIGFDFTIAKWVDGQSKKQA